MNIRETSYQIAKIEFSNPVNKVEYRNHLSILIINDKIRNPASFSCKETSLSDIKKELRNLNTKEASTFGNITPKILRASKETFLKL